MRIPRFKWSLLLALPLVLASNLALAQIGGSATPFFPPGTLTVGDGPLDARIELVATGADFPATVDANTIKLTISCGTNTDPWNCPGGLVETGVLSIDDTTDVPGGSGSGNEICNGVNFSFGAPDGTTGEILITPSVSPLTFSNPDDQCTVNLQVNVDGVPTNDASGAAGQQTAQGAEFRLTNNVNDEGGGVGADTTTIADCSVQVDKQVCCSGSCGPAGDWVDVGYDDSAVGSCVGLEDDLINIRYLARNTGQGCPLTNCGLTESNDVFDVNPGGTFALGDGVETSPPIDNSPQDCSEAFGIPDVDENEPNTISISCDTPFGGQVTDDDTASFSCLSVDLLVDRNVDCDGLDAGSDPSDMTLTRDDSDGQLGCTANDGDPINWRYQSCNNGTAPLYECRLTDDNSNVSVPIDIGDLAPETCEGPGVDIVVSDATNNSLDCSTQLESDELADGQINLTCCTRDVSGLENCDLADRVTVFDRSKVDCQTQSGLSIVKECIDEDGDGTDDTAKVTVSAGAGDLGFENCVPTDDIYLDDPTCPADVGAPTSVTLVPAGPYSLAPGGEQVSEGSFTVNDADACNTASVTCDPLSGGAAVTENAAQVVCDFQEEGCLTRTGGFWGNRPDFADAYNDDIEVCGRPLPSVLDEEQSTTEAICSVGRDGKILGSQVTQLIRQCTVAALNHAASVAEGGGCSNADVEEFEACCGAATGDGLYCAAEEDGGFSVGECIELMDEFNNSLDTLNPEAFQSPGPAAPGECQDSRNNGFHPFTEEPAEPADPDPEEVVAPAGC